MVRHGRTAWNRGGRFQGRADIPLDEEGMAQAADLAAALAPLRPARLVVSDLRRARQTAGPLARRSGLTPVVDPRLAEVDVGRWEGLRAEEAAERFPDEYRAWVADPAVARGGGETLADAGRRAADAIGDALAATAAGTAVVVVSHGLVLRAALDQLASRRVVELDGPAPHLRNAEWLDLQAVAGP